MKKQELKDTIDALKDEFSDEPPIHIMDAEDKLRIRTEYPHLNKLSEYKHWIIEKYQESMGPAAQTLIQSFDEKTWIDMYHSEFHHAAVTGFSIPKERVVSPAQLAAQAEDPVNPHSLTFENVKTVFGPKPRVVEGWVGRLHLDVREFLVPVGDDLVVLGVDVI